MRRHSMLAFAVAMGILILPPVPFSANAGINRSSLISRVTAGNPVASVRYIYRGLTVQPPRKPAAKGKRNQKLFNRYFLQTRASQRASLRFGDHTQLHINERTDVLLRSPHVTQIKKGEAYEVVSPGTDHRIQTASAVASAIGTQFDVRVQKQVRDKTGKRGTRRESVVVTDVVVVEGVVDVRNAKGDVVVRAGQQTTAVQGEAPSPARSVDATSATAWIKSIPSAKSPVGLNVALAGNGGRVISYSSESSAAAPTRIANPSRRISRQHGRTRQVYGGWAVSQIIDGLPTTGWSTAFGKVSNEWVKIGFKDEKVYTVSSIIIDPAATRGHPSSNDLKQFQVLVSSGGIDDSHFHVVLEGTTRQENSGQVYVLPTPEPAQYVELKAMSNWGSPDAVDVAEFEVVSKSKPVVVPTPVATATPTLTATSAATSTSTATPTATFAATSTSTPTPTATATSTPQSLFRYSFSGLSLSWTWQTPPPGRPQNIPPGQIVGTACGSDPLTAAWSGTVTFYAGYPFGWTATFSIMNPAIISKSYDESSGKVQGTMTIRLRLVPDPSPHMQLLADGTGDATNIVIDPADVAVQVTRVSSCP